MGELLARISSRELTEWMAYARLDPFGEERADLRAAIVASTMAEIHRDRKKRIKRFEPKEFLPRFGQEAGPVQTVEQQIRIMEMITHALGGRDLRKDKL